MDQDSSIQFICNQLLETWLQLLKVISKNPEILIKFQFNFNESLVKISQDICLINSHTHAENEHLDKRFGHKDWHDKLLYNYIKRSYFVLVKHSNILICDIENKIGIKSSQKIKFYLKQFIDALSPANFANLNPEVISNTLEANGINLALGIKKFLENIKNGYNVYNINCENSNAFKLGENIACTKGKVIYQNDLMQLIQYTPTTEETYEVPLLIISPWINKYYILDLQQENSLVKWLVDQGYSVFMISWVNPTEQHRAKKFSHYMTDGPLKALSVIKRLTGATKFNITGYCIGGTLLGCLLAFLAKKKEFIINSATFLTTLFDFSDPGDLGIFIDEIQIKLLEKEMEKKGYLSGSIMATVFNSLRVNDLVWTAFVDNYLKCQKAKPFDLLYWNGDPTNIPQQVHSFYLRNMYLNNNLIKPNRIEINKVSLDLKLVKTPSYFMAAKDDHIVPWKSAYKSIIFAGPTQFVLATSGHVAGVINPPCKNKYGYWASEMRTKNPEQYLSSAKFTQGSWWLDWIDWLKKYSGKINSINHTKLLKIKAIEDAPGTYVKTRL